MISQSEQARQQSPGVTSFFIKDILASNKVQKTSETTLCKDRLSSEGFPSCPVAEGDQDSTKLFTFPHSRVELDQRSASQEENRLQKDISDLKAVQNPRRVELAQHAHTGKYKALISLEIFPKYFAHEWRILNLNWSHDLVQICYLSNYL